MSKSVIKESLAEKTRMYIDAHPSIKDCVAKGLINYSSLARMIMKDIGVDNEEAVMIACRRYASKLSVTTDHELSILRILKDSRLEMRTKTCIVTAKNDWSVLHKMDNLFKDLWNENSIMQCVQSASAVTIIADTLLKERIIDTVGRFQPVRRRHQHRGDRQLPHGHHLHRRGVRHDQRVLCADQVHPVGRGDHQGRVSPVKPHSRAPLPALCRGLGIMYEITCVQRRIPPPDTHNDSKSSSK